MSNQEELKTMIKCFRVHDLHALLSYAGRSKYGKKSELQDRALRLLELKSQPVVLKIKQLYDSMQKGYLRNLPNVSCSESDKSPTTERDDGGGQEKDDVAILDESESDKPSNDSKGEDTKEFQNCAIQPTSSVVLAVNSLYYPIHPDVKFKTLPFYKVLYELLRPSSLISQTYSIQQKNSFVFYMTPQQTAAIYLSKEVRPGCEIDFKVQGQLRFCLLETTSPQDDSFPAGLVVRINNKSCNIQDTLLKKKKDYYSRDSSLPINITPLLKLNPAVGNKIEVQWNAEYGHVYVVGVYLVEKKTSEDLLIRLKAEGIRAADYTRGMIKDKLSEEADSEILTTSLRVSLTCPLGKMRLKTPCRASTCQHLQCFDAALFIQMNEKKPTWMCPVCDNPAEYDKLVIDGYFLEILSSDKLPAEQNEIELHNDGSWSSLVIKTEDNSRNEKDVVVKLEAEDIVDVVLEDSKGSKAESDSSDSQEADVRFESTAEKRKVDEIDLTISDSDDEPLIWYKRRESSKNKRNGVSQSNSNSNSNSNRSSPSIINLDSDSSDSLPLMISRNDVPLPPLL